MEKARQFGGPLPEAMRNAPQLLPGLDVYLEAMRELSSSRAMTEIGEGPIPYSEILVWLDENEWYNKEDRKYAIRVIQELDKAYCNYQSNKLTEARNRASKGVQK
ncbi:tail chaperonin [Pseudomonas phage Iggy]|nr:tail chaperonin [Pseudomonas phage Iggy]QEA09746.1 hypothetical protein [Pseudomonas phage Iggy]WPK40873.1 tail chaperonin [Pseudomonas phage Knedl]